MFFFIVYYVVYIDRTVINSGYFNERKYIMYKYLVVLAAALTLNAQEGPKGPPPQDGHPGRPHRPKLTEEQKKQRDAIVVKYDTNKDGKLDKEERAKVSEEDRKTLKSFGPPPGGPRGPRKDGPPPEKK